ncbi:MAG TPA: hypothetical protein VKB27_01685 [Gammaproteobacteria bacterium]|nr:hypothetical protein [Gammaproteobacteria bacterium]
MSAIKLNRRQVLQAGVCLGCGLLLSETAKAATIHEMSGAVHINKLRATAADDIEPGDIVSTADNGHIAFSVGGDAFLVREFSSVRVGNTGSSLLNTLELFAGKLLGVFETGRRRNIYTGTATMGIRGTACYLDVRPKSTYFCTCYGETEVISGGEKREFEATHHNPQQLDFVDGKLTSMQATGMRGHGDDELRQLEAYVGRLPRFDRG